jgi:Matrixin
MRLQWNKEAKTVRHDGPGANLFQRDRSPRLAKSSGQDFHWSRTLSPPSARSLLVNQSLRFNLISAAALVVTFSVASQHAAAYATVGSRWPSNGPNGSVILTYSYENMFDGALKQKNGQPVPAYIIRQSIENAFQLWANVVPISFVEVPDDGLGYGLSTHFGQLRFRHVFINGPDPPVGDPIAKAQAYFPGGGDYSGDVEFDHSDPWEVIGTLHEPDILGAATHEIGHTLGLNHTDVIGANMYWIFRRTAGLNDGWLHPDDIAGMQSIYGPGSGTVTPLFAVPEPATWMPTLAALISLLAASRVLNIRS